MLILYVKWTEFTQAARKCAQVLLDDLLTILWWPITPVRIRRLNDSFGTRLGASTGRLIDLPNLSHQTYVHTRAIGFNADHRRVEVGHVNHQWGGASQEAGRPLPLTRTPSVGIPLRGTPSRASRGNKKVTLLLTAVLSIFAGFEILTAQNNPMYPDQVPKVFDLATRPERLAMITPAKLGYSHWQLVPEDVHCLGRVLNGMIRYFVNGSVPYPIVGFKAPSGSHEITNDGTWEDDTLLTLYGKTVVSRFFAVTAEGYNLETTPTISFECYNLGKVNQP